MSFDNEYRKRRRKIEIWKTNSKEGKKKKKLITNKLDQILTTNVEEKKKKEIELRNDAIRDKTNPRKSRRYIRILI